MRHPLLQFLLKPMAAPETPWLRRLRGIWMLLCTCLAVAVPLNAPSVGLFGPLGALPALLLILATPVMGLVYFRGKARADAAHTCGEAP